MNTSLKCAHRFVLLCYCHNAYLIDSLQELAHILQGYFTSAESIMINPSSSEVTLMSMSKIEL